MKSIELKQISFDVLGQEQTLDYREMLIAIMASPADPNKGTDINEIRRSIRVLDMLENSSEVLTLEDADFEYLKSRVKSARFTANHRVFAEFVDNITGD